MFFDNDFPQNALRPATHRRFNRSDVCNSLRALNSASVLLTESIPIIDFFLQRPLREDLGHDHYSIFKSQLNDQSS